jgi:phosphoserine aminotransferase
MSTRIFNFSAGPAVLPESVLEEARDNLLSLGDTGIGVLEHSHRGPAMIEVFEEAERLCRKLAAIPDNYRVLFLQGGASTQFATIPMNFLDRNSTADYLVTGSWSKKAVQEAKMFGTVRIACNGADENFSRIPAERDFSESPAYVHFTSNNTIFGTQFPTEPIPPGDAPLVCDASSDIFSREIDVSKYGLIYAGAQKNLGPSGVTLVVIRDDLVERGAKEIPTMFQYRTHAQADSCYNTPPTFGVYLMKLVFQWILDQGGLAGVREINERKAGKLYSYLDESSLFRPTADPACRSRMNVTFVTGDPELDAQFVAFARDRRLDGLKGHRSVGGMRASIYNAFPEAGVEHLIETMREFEDLHSDAVSRSSKANA